MILYFLFFFLFPFVLMAKIEIVSDFQSDPPPEGTPFDKLPFFDQVKLSLQPFGVEAAPGDLDGYHLGSKARGLFRKKKMGLNEGVSHLVFWNLPKGATKFDLARLPKEKLILFAWEPPTVQKRLYRDKTYKLFSKIYTWNDDLVDNVKFFKFYYPVCRPME